MERHGDVRVARKLANEAFRLRTQADKRTGYAQAENRRELRQEARSLLADARRLEAQAVESILNEADIICATTTGLDSEWLGECQFDLAVIDEACQSTEPGCWIPLLRSQRVVLAGDHCQLPPTIISREAAAEGFQLSLFERLMLQHQHLHRQLTIQYRMHQDIMAFSSREFYHDTLVAAPEVSEHLLGQLGHVQEEHLTMTPVEFYDTAGAGFDEEKEPDGDSRRNPREAQLVELKVRSLLAAGLTPHDVAVIAPYAAQARLLRQNLAIENLEIDTVDGFQGREKEVIIITLVRSNLHGVIGFLSDDRRMNVALTRARRKLLVIGDSATLGSHPFYQRLLEYFEEIGAYRTVWEVPELW